MTPVIGIVCFAIILASWFGGVRYFSGIPAGLVAIARRHGDRLGLAPRSACNIGGMSVAQRDGSRSRTSASRVPLPAFGHVFSRLPVPRRDPGHRDSVRHLRSGRGDRQRRERRRRRRQLPDHARADRRRRGQPDRLPDGQSVHQRGLHRPSGLEGDGRAHRLLGGDRRHGDRAVLVRHHLADVVADPGRRDLADPALHRHADRRAGVPGDAEGATRRRSSWR